MKKEDILKMNLTCPECQNKIEIKINAEVAVVKFEEAEELPWVNINKVVYPNPNKVVLSEVDNPIELCTWHNVKCEDSTGAPQEYHRCAFDQGHATIEEEGIKARTEKWFWKAQLKPNEIPPP